jgi:hypothetical protein
MKKIMNLKITSLALVAVLSAASCADNELEVLPNDSNFPFQLVLDTDEGGDLADAEDYGLEITFADYLGELPNQPIVITYELKGEDSFAGNVEIDEVIYEVEVGDCVFERELAFNTSARTITIAPDRDLGTIPESIEVVFELPGEDDTEGGFEFEIKSIQTNAANVVLGDPAKFEYEVLDNEVAGEWELEFDTKAQFDEFKNVFRVISADLGDTDFADIDGKVVLEFEFAEAQFEIELNEEEEVCEDGETDTENKTVEIETEYDADDGELELEGSHEIIGDDGEVEDELDFVIEAEYEIDEDEETLTLTITKIIDEDNFESGKELFKGKKVFVFKKD